MKGLCGHGEALQEMVDTINEQVESKATVYALQQAEESSAVRMTNIENAMLKGLKAVSDKAAKALATKVSTAVRSSRHSAQGQLLSTDHEAIHRLALRRAGVQPLSRGAKDSAGQDPTGAGRAATDGTRHRRQRPLGRQHLLVV